MKILRRKVLSFLKKKNQEEVNVFRLDYQKTPLRGFLRPRRFSLLKNTIAIRTNGNPTVRYPVNKVEVVKFPSQSRIIFSAPFMSRLLERCRAREQFPFSLPTSIIFCIITSFGSSSCS